MKKIVCITILLVCLVSCISCDGYVEKFDSREQEIRQNRIEEQLTPDTTDCVWNMQNVKFDGHLYVVYTERFGVAMVHSQNCKCIGTIK